MKYVYFFKFKKLTPKEIEKIIEPYFLDKFEIYTPLKESKLEFAIGAVIDEPDIDYLKDKFTLADMEFHPASKEEFIQAKENVGIDYTFIKDGQIGF